MGTPSRRAARGGVGVDCTIKRRTIGLPNAAHVAGCMARPLRDRRGSDRDCAMHKTLGATGTHAETEAGLRNA
jgi:hypothetical protein